MSKKKGGSIAAPVTEAQLAETPQLSAKEQLDSIIAALDNDSSDDPGLLTNTPVFVPESQILIADPAALQNSIAKTHASNPKLASLSPAFAQELSALEHALGHSETVKTMPATFAIGNAAMQMPREVRDHANALYYQKGRDGKPHFVREKADKLLAALFGSALAPRVFRAAAMRGFAQKPFVWISQTLWLHVETDEKHSWVKTNSFNEAVDRAPASPVMQALFMCFYTLTVRNISRMAADKNISALDVLRSIFTDICDGLKIDAAMEKEVNE